MQDNEQIPAEGDGAFLDEEAVDASVDSGEPDESEFGLTIPGYELVNELNRGGQAIIFRARQRSTGRKVAIKILLEGPLGSEVDRSRMEREVRILASLDHPNIVSAIDRGETREGWPYFVLEYAEGQILAEYMDEFRQKYPPIGLPPDLGALLRLFARICEAINAAHLRGVVHRDIKPANIVVDPYGEPHILDFGVARAPLEWVTEKDQLNPDTSMGEFLGSLQWASPEQVDGDSTKIDIRADVYSLGMILYEMLTGEFPYDVFCGIREVLDNIVHAVPALPSEVIEERLGELDASRQNTIRRTKNPVDAVLDGIVLKALEKDPNDRYQSAGELGRDILDYLDGKVTRVAPARKKSRVMPMSVIFGGVTALAILTGVVVSVLLSGRSQPPIAEEPEVVRREIVVVDEDVYGYHLEKDEVLFEFDVRDYDVARMADGALGSVREVAEIERVSVAGPFNGWVKDDSEWFMKKSGRNSYSLRKKLDVFAAKSEWPFKFVVNNAIWVGAPEEADNRMVVAEDTATYNLILKNPRNVSDASAEELRKYRQEINSYWPGQGQHLAVDKEGEYHFTFTHFAAGTMLKNLDGLRGIPLSTLNLGDLRVSDVSVLKDMKTLQTFICNDAMYWKYVSGVIPALERGDGRAALKEAEEIFKGYEQNPACAAFRALVLDSVLNYQALQDSPEKIPVRTEVFAGHHYMVVLIPMTWYEAKAFAEEVGGHLAAVKGPKVQQWITETFGLPSMGRRFWLGGTDEKSEGNWSWVSGMRWEYENWTRPEPNNNNGEEHVLAMRADGWWIDANGHGLKLPFLIEWVSASL